MKQWKGFLWPCLLLLSLEGLSQVPSESVSRIGVVLPLSGSFAVYGKRTLAAMKLGFNLPCGNVEEGVQKIGSLPLQLVVKDSKASKEQGIQVIKNLVEQHQIVLVLGDVVSEVDGVVAGQAEQLLLPHLALSSKEGISRLDGYTFQMGWSVSKEAKELAQRAIRDLRLKKIAVFYPNNAFGRLFKDVFSKALLDLKGQVVALESYEPTQTTFTKNVQSLKNKWRKTGVDGILIPSPIKELKLILPALLEGDVLISQAPQVVMGYHKVHQNKADPVQLLGTHHWNDPSLISTVGSLAEGAVWVDGANWGMEKKHVTDFKNQFQACMHSAPSLMELSAYEAALLVRSIFAEPLQTAGAVRLKLLQTKQDGLFGPIVYRAGMGFERAFLLMQLKEGRIVTKMLRSLDSVKTDE